MASRKSFNWSLLDRYNLMSMMHQLGPKVIGKRISIAQLHPLISAHIKSHIPVRVRYCEDHTQVPGLIYMGGAYYSDYDRQGRRQIEVVLSYNTYDTFLKLTKKQWSRLCSLFADTILHEVIHMRQYRTRKFKAIPGYESTVEFAKQRRDQEYYGHKDELGAFSFNVACELVDKFGYDPDAIWQYMDSNRAKRNKKTTYFKYLAAFDFNHDHKIIRKLKRKVMHQLTYACHGKPFKTTDHLTY